MKSPALALLLALAACSTDPQPQPEPVRAGPLDVRSLSYPAHWLVEKVGSEHVQVRNILPLGADAPQWQPEAELIAGLAMSDLIVANGAGFEAWLATATIPTDKLVLTATGLDLIHTQGVTHSHGADGGHSHAGTDPHTWGSPALYSLQAQALANALGQAVPAQAPSFAQAADALAVELQKVSEGYAAAFARAGDAKLAANHPAYNYLAREMKVQIQAFDFDPGQAPSQEQVAAFDAWAGDAHAPILLWEAVPSMEVKAAFPDGVRHVWLDPLEQPVRGSGYDYLVQVRANIAIIDALFPPGEDDEAAVPAQGPPKLGPPTRTKPGPMKGVKANKAGR